MSNLKEQSERLCELLGYQLDPVGMHFTETKPTSAIGFRKKGGGCVAPLIYSAAKGHTVAFDEATTGFPCSAFYLGYADKIFDGIEQFLSNTESGTIYGRECERFVQSPELVSEFLSSMEPKELRKGAIVFKPISDFAKDEKPLTVTFYANSDQMSALVMLIDYRHPLSLDRVRTGFASSCISVFTYPLIFIGRGEEAAFWGSHDVAQRLQLPADVTSLTMPLTMYEEILEIMDESFLGTHIWKDVRNRIVGTSNKEF